MNARVSRRYYAYAVEREWNREANRKRRQLGREPRYTWELGGPMSNPGAILSAVHRSAVRWLYLRLTEESTIHYGILHACLLACYSVRRQFLSALRHGRDVSYLSCEEEPLYFLHLAIQDVYKRKHPNAASVGHRMGVRWHLHILEEEGKLIVGPYHNCDDPHAHGHQTVWTREDGFLKCHRNADDEPVHVSGICRCFRQRGSVKARAEKLLGKKETARAYKQRARCAP